MADSDGLVVSLQEQGTGDVMIDAGKAVAERQRQQLDWREASTSQVMDARACQPLPQVCTAPGTTPHPLFELLTWQKCPIKRTASLQ